MKEEYKFPKRFGDYSFVRVLQKRGISNQFLLGLYEDSFGRRAVAKQWNGSPYVWSSARYWLRNEIKAYRLMHALYEKKSSVIEKACPHIRIPKIIAVLEERNRMILLLEMLEGSPPETKNITKFVNSLEEAVRYFQFINKVNDFKKEKLLRRSLWYILINFPRILITALLKHPRYAKDIIVGAGMFLQCAPAIMSSQEMAFVHRDLSPSNVIVKDTTVGIIDFELAVLTHAMLETVHVVLGSWHIPGFIEAFYKSQLMQEIFSDEKSFRAYKAFSLYVATHWLSTNLEMPNAVKHAYLVHAISLASPIRKT